MAWEHIKWYLIVLGAIICSLIHILIDNFESVFMIMNKVAQNINVQIF